MKSRIILAVSISALFTLISVISCKKPDLQLNTTEDVNVVGYLEKYPDSFSLFRQMLVRTDTRSFLNAYGSYTVFVPANSGVKAWLTTIGAASVDAVDVNILKEIVKFHILQDTVNTASFKDGKLPVPTMHGQFLVTGTSNSGGVTSYGVNRQAIATQLNIRVGNGIIHVINNVLTPAKKTIAEDLEANPDYSIFVQALKETGFYTLLNTVDPDTTKRWKTLIAESNRALADSGITSYAALKTKYSKTGNPASPLDSLNLYIAYHIIDGVNYLGDIITAASHLTLQPQEVVTTKLINNEVVLNEDEFDGVVEKGILLIRSKSDNSATNGVWHDANAHFSSKVRVATAVYWDMSFTEVQKMPAIYQKSSLAFNKTSAEHKPIKEIDWEYKGANGLTYAYSTTSSLSNFACRNDQLMIQLGAPSNNNRPTWIEFITPPIIKGRYKVWICYRNRNNISFNVKVDGQLMDRPVNMSTGYPGGTDAELESLHWKRYTLGGSFAGRMVGIADIKTTERHVLRFEIINGSNAENHFDMVHFIPIDQPNHWLPRFAPDGSKVFL
jgi:uncharacterized surface protein with fasciclin (FAS1) repeats